VLKKLKKMIRELQNKLCGRSKLFLEVLTGRESINLIKNIDPTLLEKISFSMSCMILYQEYVKNPNLNKLIDYLQSILEDYKCNKNMPHKSGDFFRSIHESFSDKHGKEKHYIDLGIGNDNLCNVYYQVHIEYLLKGKY